MSMRRLQQGTTIIEVLGALSIATIMLMSLNLMIDASLDDAKGQQAAWHQAQAVNAASKYITAHYDGSDGGESLVSQTSDGSVVTVTVAQLKTGGFLSSSFSNTNAFNQTPCILVRQSSPGKLDALVATYGGQAIPDRDIPLVGMNAGQGGGYISTAAPGTARGASWSLNTTAYRGAKCDGTTVLNGSSANDGGHLVSSLFYDGPGQLPADFLYRTAVPGRSELNQMKMPIAMAGNALVTPGTACDGTQAAFGIVDATRTLAVCGKDNLWHSTSNWKEPVSDHNALLALAGNTEGDVRMATDTGRAFTYHNGSWVALAVDENGNMNVPGTLTAQTVHATNQVNSDGTMTAQGDITSNETVTANGVRGNWVDATNWLQGPSMYFNQWGAAGTACDIVNADGSTTWPLGTMMRDRNGYTLSCVWTNSGSKFMYENTTPP
ncbi:MAG TPA: shufflon system plasmid conjugative transfer pilus tip adhesin PilV [Noviherbaspirillum sp.]